MNRNGAPTGKEPTIAKSFSRLAHDAIELSELQVELLKLDARDTTRQVRVNLVLSIVALVVLLGCTPVALLTLAEALSQYLAWSRFASLLTATLVGMAICGILLAIVWNNLSRGVGTFQRSREEFSRNVDWLKSSLRSGAAGQERDEWMPPPK